jgi:phage tail sheath protein FI
VNKNYKMMYNKDFVSQDEFLNNIKNLRGIYDFKVICDTTNNTPNLIDDNQLIVDIYIKPARAINWITLKFTATRTDANFDELVS